MSIEPLPGLMCRVAPASAATMPAHAPAAEMTARQPIVRSSAVRASRARTAADRAGRVALEADDRRVAMRLGAVLARAGEVGVDELPRLERGVGHAVGRTDLRG